MLSHHWQKSSYSGSSNACVEVRVMGGLVELRDSDDGAVVIRTAPAVLVDLLHAIKVGDLDHHA
ncbi:DUF397 domain-containing protein [Streptomyces sp. NRRL S-495]|uniref:DUF397 domain-containing protein n=1 Tax=Streptomyces sp. NRRL S-495 TaxID=1609133 RepID=UPI0005F89C9A|nr:DUF397 domain-containing protein [Streptomyces sp. NRRL S-495]KJY26018.1 hypothetical protein VR45_38025 [Streptomyces sp. NRRL S-495]